MAAGSEIHLRASSKVELKFRCVKKQAQRQEEARRRRSVAALVYLAGAEVLDDAELLGALLIHLQSRRDNEIRKDAREVGQAKLQASTAPH